jgi:hypothetical protein
MYRKDHPPPHVHLFYGAFEAIMRISDGQLLAGYVPKRQLREARSMCQQFREPWTELFNKFNPPRHA